MKNTLPFNFVALPDSIVTSIGEFTEAELKVIIVIFSKTFKYGKAEDWISRSQFVKLTGLSDKSIDRATKRLVKDGHLAIERRQAKGGTAKHAAEKVPYYRWIFADNLSDELEITPRNLSDEPPAILPPTLEDKQQEKKDSEANASPPPEEKKQRVLSQRDLLRERVLFLEGRKTDSLDARGVTAICTEYNRYLTDLDRATKSIGAESAAVIESYFAAPDRFPFGPRAERTLRRLRAFDVVKAVVALGGGGVSEAKKFISECHDMTDEEIKIEAGHALRGGRITAQTRNDVFKVLNTPKGIE